MKARTATAIATSIAAYATGTIRQPPGIHPPRYPAAGTAVRMPGRKTRSSFVPDAPTLPAPNIPRANPLVRDGNHAEFQAIPTVKWLPARPNSRAQAIICG